MNYPAELVFAAACTAQRINDAYVKSVKWPDVADPAETRQPNKVIVASLLQCTTPADKITP